MKRYPHWPIHLALLAVSTIMLVPFYWVLKTSLTGENIFAYPPALLPKDPHPFFYVDVWYAIPFFRYLVNSFGVASLVVVGQLVTASLAAYAFAFLRFPAKNFLFLVFLATFMVPWEATIIPNYLTIRDLGWIDTYQGLAVPFMATGFGTFLLRQSFLQLPRAVHAVAEGGEVLAHGEEDRLLVIDDQHPMGTSGLGHGRSRARRVPWPRSNPRPRPHRDLRRPEDRRAFWLLDGV